MVNKPDSEYLAEKPDNRDQFLQRHVRALPEAAKQTDEVLGTQLGPGEACRHALSPLCHGPGAGPLNSHFLLRSKHIAVAVMFMLVAPGIAPIIEDLAAENMSPD